MMKSNNEEYGFHHELPEQWDNAVKAIMAATKEDEEDVVLFLDSRDGRHFADSVVNLGMAGAINQWMTWKTSKKMARELGIPKGLPYLTALVIEISTKG